MKYMFVIMFIVRVSMLLIAASKFHAIASMLMFMVGECNGPVH